METFSSKVKTIWITDDDDDDLFIFQDALKEIHPVVNITTFYSGGDLLNALITFTAPDLLFLDLKLPIIIGTDCLFLIRSQENHKRLPIIIYSSSLHPSDIFKSYELGASLFLSKPGTYTKLCQNLKALLEFNWDEVEKIKKDHCVAGKYVPFMTQKLKLAFAGYKMGPLRNPLFLQGIKF